MSEKGKSSLVLYKLDGGPPSCAVMMLCDILDLEYEPRRPDFLNREQKSSEYKKMNPMGTIPVLYDGDFVISESHAAMKYLLSKYGKEQEERLYPSDLETRAILDQCLFFDASVLFIRLKEVALPSVYGDVKETSEKNKEDIEDAYFVLEAYLENNKYIAADHLTLADLSLGATTNGLQPIHKLDENKFPRTVKWLNVLNQETFFKKISLHGTELLSQLLQQRWEENRNKK